MTLIFTLIRCMFIGLTAELLCRAVGQLALYLCDNQKAGQHVEVWSIWFGDGLNVVTNVKHVMPGCGTAA